MKFLSLTICFSASSPPLMPSKSLKSGARPQFSLSNDSSSCYSSQVRKSSSGVQLVLSKLCGKDLAFVNSHHFVLRPQFSSVFLGLSFPLSCLASETTATEEMSNKINLESLLISIDDFFTKYPFFVTSFLFVWLVVIPAIEQYMRKYKFVSALNAFRKLQEDPSSQLLDIRNGKSLAYLGSPNLKMLNKNVVQLEFVQGDEDDFVKKILKSFGEPANTTVCVIDSFDGNSIKVAELLVQNGFKEAYAIRGGIRGTKGWQEIQENLLPASVHVDVKKKSQTRKFKTNGDGQQATSTDSLSSNSNPSFNNGNKVMDQKDFRSIHPTTQSEGPPRPSSPYPNYPDFKPPSSPSPSKPNK